jgi:hypothetical protein
VFQQDPGTSFVDLPEEATVSAPTIAPTIIATPAAPDPSLQRMRTMVGLLALCLPLVLALGKIALGEPALPGSISAYYYTGMRDVFVGSLWAVGVFMILYRNGTVDDRVTSVAGVCAVLVAIFPTAPAGELASHGWVPYVHLAAATTLFMLLAVLAAVRFPVSDPGVAADHAKHVRVAVYRACGAAIALSVGAALVDGALARTGAVGPGHLFWYESVALMAFGISWLVKSRALPVGRVLGEAGRTVGVATDPPRANCSPSIAAVTNVR